jgi:hypothetical protein
VMQNRVGQNHGVATLPLRGFFRVEMSTFGWKAKHRNINGRYVLQYYHLCLGAY